MPTTRAVVVDPATSEHLVIREFPYPQPLPSQAVVKVHAISLNRGEVRYSMTAPAGRRPGWDFAGVVEKAAADGTGPKAGTRVVGMLNVASWAEYIAAPTNAVAEIPENVSFAQASTLPVAGLTALHSLYKGGFLLHRPILITGATGGTGDFACQLARLAGTIVVPLCGAKIAKLSSARTARSNRHRRRPNTGRPVRPLRPDHRLRRRPAFRKSPGHARQSRHLRDLRHHCRHGAELQRVQILFHRLNHPLRPDPLPGTKPRTRQRKD